MTRTEASYGRRIMSAALLATTFALGFSGLGHAALAHAEGGDPAESDVLDMEIYEACMKKTVRSPQECCIKAGGIPGSAAAGDADNCYAPPPKPASLDPGRVPHRVIPGDAPLLTPSMDPSADAIAPARWDGTGVSQK
jgi:hypothetical protein